MDIRRNEGFGQGLFYLQSPLFDGLCHRGFHIIFHGSLTHYVSGVCLAPVVVNGLWRL